MDSSESMKEDFSGRIYSALLIASRITLFGYRVGFYPITTISKLINLKNPTSPHHNLGIYKISCGECNSFYIGQTGRKFGTRLLEHHAAYRSRKTQESAIAAHCLQENHDMIESTGELLHTCGKGRTMNRMEEAEIISAKVNNGDDLLNDIGVTYLNPFIRFFYKFKITHHNSSF